MNAFETGDAHHINQVTFYAVLSSLEKLTVVVTQKFKDALTVSTELVNFVSMNISVEAADRLVEQSAELKISFVDISRKLYIFSCLRTPSMCSDTPHLVFWSHGN